MAGIDASIPLGVKPPDTMSTLGSIMKLQGQRQELETGAIQQKRAGIQLQQERGDLDARNAVAAIVKDPQYRDPATGMFDLDRGAPAILTADPKNYHATKAISEIAKNNGDIITVKRNALGLADTSRALVGSTVGALASNPSLTKEQVNESLDTLEQQAPDAKPAIDVWRRHLKNVPDDPRVLQAYTTVARNQAMPPATQNAAMTQSGPRVDNGQQSQDVNTNPGAGPIGAPIPGTRVQKQLPPTTQVFNPETNAMEFLGPQPTASGADLSHGAPPPNGQIEPSVQAARETFRKRQLQQEMDQVSKMPDSPVKRAAMEALQTELGAAPAGTAPAAPAVRAKSIQSGPALGQAENASGTAAVVNKDWETTVERARTAAQDVGVLQNIKQYAKGAVMGVANDRRSYLAGMAGLLGMDAAQLEKTNTDLLAKNSNMLALAGGDTNLAKQLAETIVPSSKMTPEAAEHAANQVIAQRKMDLVKQQYLSHFKGDAELYTKKLAHFNDIADPRALQIAEMSDQEIARMKAAMSPSERKEFGTKVRELQSLGFVK